MAGLRLLSSRARPGPAISASFLLFQHAVGLVAGRAEALGQGWGGSFAGVEDSSIQSKCSSSGRWALSQLGTGWGWGGGDWLSNLSRKSSESVTESAWG